MRTRLRAGWNRRGTTVAGAVAVVVVAAGVGAVLVAGPGGPVSYVGPSPAIGSGGPSQTPSPEIPSPGPSAESTATPSRPSPSLSPSAGPSPAPSVRHCSSSDVTLSLTTDRPVYVSGETVRFIYTLKNVSASACDVDETDMHVQVYDARDRAVLEHPPGIYLYPTPPPPYTTANRHVLGRGESYTDEDCTWDTHDYVGAPGGGSAPSGSYHAIAYWTYPSETSAPAYFTITGGPTPPPSPGPSPAPSPSPSPSPSLLPI